MVVSSVGTLTPTGPALFLSVRVSAYKLGVELKIVFVSVPDLGCILVS